MYRITAYFTEDNEALAILLTELQGIVGLYGIYTYPAIARYVSKVISTAMSPKVTKIEIYVAEPSEARDRLATSALNFASRIMIEPIKDIY